MQYSEYREHDGVALAGLVRDGQVTASEVLEAAIARAEQVNGRINAISRTMYESARERARDLPAAQDASSPLRGVPFLLKDLQQEWAGTISSGGSRSLLAAPARETAEVVRRWLDAGLVPFGRTNAPEFGIKPITEPEAFGPTRNPWALHRTSGGSSGGAAAAVAAGVVPVAGASDGGGSIRIPAACCGLFGLKAGRGLVPSGPARAENFHGAALDGVLSRSVRDGAAGLDALVGPAATAPYAAAAPQRPFADELEREPGELRIGFSARSALGEPHADAVTAVEDAAELLRSSGHEVQAVEPPVDLDALAVDFLRAWTVKVAASVDEVVRATGAPASSFELDTRLLAAVGRAVPGPEYVATLDRWHEHTRRLAEFHERYDLLLTPGLAGPPVQIGELDTSPVMHALGKAVLGLRLGGVLRSTGLVDRLARENLRHVPYTQLANMTGRPAMSVPLHWNAEGVPLGVQFVGPLAGEGTLFRLAGQLERARPWAHRRPPL